MALLDVENLKAGYGRIEVLHGVSLELEVHKLCAIIGANGAGKTTLLMTLSRLLPIRGGAIRFLGRDLAHVGSHDVVRAGMVHVPEGRRVLAHLTVEENLLVAAAIRTDFERKKELGELYERFPSLGRRRSLPAGMLSGGEQQMLALGRALVMRPKALLLDEPSMGLAPKLVDQIFEIVKAERARGTSILLVEQNARRALALADYAYVLERGSIAIHGTGAELLGREEIAAAYLGESDSL